jgi:hypothetical protein
MLLVGAVNMVSEISKGCTATSLLAARIVCAEQTFALLQGMNALPAAQVH